MDWLTDGRIAARTHWVWRISWAVVGAFGLISSRVLCAFSKASPAAGSNQFVGISRAGQGRGLVQGLRRGTVAIYAWRARELRRLISAADSRRPRCVSQGSCHNTNAAAAAQRESGWQEAAGSAGTKLRRKGRSSSRAIFACASDQKVNKLRQRLQLYA